MGIFRPNWTETVLDVPRRRTSSIWTMFIYLVMIYEEP